jgi:glycosyltransferase involved in cell wall biosynthesis
LADRLGLGDRILFAGKQTRTLPGFYGLARVTVLPTTLESFGQVLLESMACGTPAVGFGGAPGIYTATSEIIRDGETGRVISDASPERLAQGIDSLLKLSEETYRAMSLTCVEEARTRFSWKRFVQTLLAET